MNWDALAALSQAIAAIAVVLSVGYLAAQIKKNTLATQSQTYQMATAELAEMAATIGVSTELARIFRLGLLRPGDLAEDEFHQFAYLGISLFRRFENVFFQHRAGVLDDDFWIGHRENILWFFHRPGTQAWWPERKYAFSQSFREFLDRSKPGDVTSPGMRRV